jgi:hypothetical protein
VENGISIKNNLSADWVDQRFETPRRVCQTKQRYLWIEERFACHVMPQATSIILHEV